MVICQLYAPSFLHPVLMCWASQLTWMYRRLREVINAPYAIHSTVAANHSTALQHLQFRAKLYTGVYKSAATEFFVRWPSILVGSEYNF